MGAVIQNADAVNVALLALRASLGLMIAAHGLNKFLGGGKIPGTARWFDSIGMRPGHLNALAAAVTEVGVGALLVLGLAVPLAAAGLVALMTVAMVTVHAKNGFFVFRPGQGIEYCLMTAVAAVVCSTLGPGEWSIDHAAGWWHYSAAAGLAIALGLGLVAAGLQLAVVWRPGRTDA